MYFLVFEGLDGSGKSSLMRELQAELTRRHQAFVVSREPGGTPLGEKLRDLILEKSNHPPGARAELLMYEASRAQHVEFLIQPNLQAGKWVLSDRFSASSLAFQGGARGISWEMIEQLNDFATQGLKPHLNVLLDLSVEESERRRQQREKSSGLAPDRIESEDRAFHQRVREGFLRASRQDPSRWLVLDASLATETLFQQLLQELTRRKWLP